MDWFEEFMLAVRSALGKVDENIESEDYGSMIEKIREFLYGTEEDNCEK